MKRVWIGVGILVVIVGFIFAPGRTISGILNDALNVHPFSWTLILLAVVAMVFAMALSETDYASLAWIACVVFAVGWFVWLFFQGPAMYSSLYKQTSYKESTLIEQSAIRDIPYTVAMTNFEGTNPDSRTGPGDLDYVQGSWIASIDPKGWNVISMPSQGFFLYDPNSEDRVVRIVQEMPFAEGGMFFNSATYFVRSEAFFAQFYEILYVQDRETGEVFAVVSLIKRAGFTRWPYVANVLLIHGDGRPEMLTVEQAEADPRLADIALKPEWMMEQEVKAYSYRYGVANAIFKRMGRISLQSSSVNDENKPPFHLETPYGNYWYTPFSPLNSQSLVGIAMSPSHDIDGTVFIWRLPVGQAYGGADFMTSLIEGSPDHQDLAWFRQTGDTKCGNMTVLEMIPIVRNEDGINRLYFLGYVSNAPKSVQVLFYTVVDPQTQVVFEDLFTPEQVNSWLRGEIELSPQTGSGMVTSPDAACTTMSDDISSQPTAELIEIVNKIIEELGLRAK